jgi:hypothetical protein
VCWKQKKRSSLNHPANRQPQVIVRPPKRVSGNLSQRLHGLLRLSAEFFHSAPVPRYSHNWGEGNRRRLGFSERHRVSSQYFAILSNSKIAELPTTISTPSQDSHWDSGQFISLFTVRTSVALSSLIKSFPNVGGAVPAATPRNPTPKRNRRAERAPRILVEKFHRDCISSQTS